MSSQANLSLRQAQRIVDVHVTQHGGYWSSLAILAQIIEEIGELAQLINYLYGGEAPEEENKAMEELGIELCDMLYAVICLANSENIDLQSSLETMMSKYMTRDEG